MKLNISYRMIARLRGGICGDVVCLQCELLRKWFISSHCLNQVRSSDLLQDLFNCILLG